MAESERNLEEAARNNFELPYDEMIERVWSHAPHPTDNGEKFIAAVREELTNAANPAAVAEAVALTINEIDTAIDEMLEMGILRRKPGAEGAATPNEDEEDADPPPRVPVPERAP